MRPQDLVERALVAVEHRRLRRHRDETSSANLRWAGNTLTTNGVMRGRSLTVIAVVDGAEGAASGVVSRSNVGLDEIEQVVRAAEAAAARPARPRTPGRWSPATRPTPTVARA